jgi:3-isopropylmalate/(R)-2-methylmalate dehydratase small subunit
MSLETVRGRVAYIFAEDDFDVDQIIGVENIRLTDPDALAACAMRQFDPDFADLVQPGDVVVGGENFGYGHPHFAPMIGLRHLGIRAVAANSFATGYWREEIAEGFPQVACPGITGLVARWDTIEIDWRAGEIRNLTSGSALPILPYSEAELGMLKAGGLVPYLRARLAAGEA